MEKQVIFRDRQEFQAADVNNVEDYTELSLQHFVRDAITPERLFTGFLVTNPSATELSVAPGHLWDGVDGNVYVSEEAKSMSLISYLPVTDQRWLTLSLIGQTEEVDVAARDFLIDLSTLQTEPRQVAMTEAKVADLNIVSGLESSDPQKKNAPTGYTLIAYVRLSPSGVEEIVMSTTNQLMSLFATWQATKTNKAWIDGIDPQISSIKSDLAALAAQLSNLKPSAAVIAELTRDVAGLKDLQGLPDTYSSYGSDWFLTEAESDTAEVDYHARVEEGIRFPWANQKQVQPDLFNPYADEVVNFNGLLLPAHEDNIRLDLSNNYAGNMAIGSYQYATHTLCEGSRSKTRIQYGPTRDVCSNNKNYSWLNSANVGSTVTYDGVRYLVTKKWGEHGAGFYWFRIQKLWKTNYIEKYSYDVTQTYDINGSQVGQTILAHQSGWLTGIDLYFDTVSEAGDVNLMLCETDLGQPDIKKVLGKTTLAPGSLSSERKATLFAFSQPIFMEAGKLYALVLITQGSHKIALTQGTNYTQGTLFYSTDGVYYQGDFTKDFMMRLHFAKFSNPLTRVELTSLDLDGGIADLDLKLGLLEPANTEMTIEFRKEGDSLWYPMEVGNADQLNGLPALLHLRAAFKGDEFVMPGVDLTNSTFQAARPGTAFAHISIDRTLAVASAQIVVTLRLENWNADKHTCTAKVRIADALTEATSVTETEEPKAALPTVVKKFTFDFSATPISEFRIQVEGTSTNALDIFHVAYLHYLAS